jgi:hypothetical protein
LQVVLLHLSISLFVGLWQGMVKLTGINQHAQAEAIILLNLLQTTARDDRVKLYAALDEEIAASGKAVSGHLGRLFAQRT